MKRAITLRSDGAVGLLAWPVVGKPPSLHHKTAETEGPASPEGLHLLVRRLPGKAEKLCYGKSARRDNGQPVNFGGLSTGGLSGPCMWLARMRANGHDQLQPRANFTRV